MRAAVDEGEGVDHGGLQTEEESSKGEKSRRGCKDGGT